VIWTENYRNIVKHKCPELLRSRKRGKRAGVRNRVRGIAWKGKIKTSLPSIFLVNTNRLYNKVDEIEAILSTKLLQNCCVIAVTETWLDQNISDSQISLTSFNTIRADRVTEQSCKKKGGGLALYINKSWCSSFKVVSTHCSKYLETMAVSARPFWSPREISSFLFLIIYCPVFESTNTSVTKETIDTIHQQIDQLERLNPNATLIVLGDLNSVDIKRPKLYQQVTATTKLNRTLDKLYIRKKDSYKCYKLPRIGNSDHHPVVLLPKYTPVSKSTTRTEKISVRDWSSDNISKLICSLETTEWDTLLDEEDINCQVDILTDYLSFCLDDCIPSVRKPLRHDKPYINAKIRKLLATRHCALITNDSTLLKSLNHSIQSELRLAKRKHARKIESAFSTSDSRSWNKLTALLRLKSKDTCKCEVEANSLNQFFSRFENELLPKYDLPPISETPDIPIISEDNVISTLKRINSRKSAGPDKIPGRLLKVGAHALGAPLCKLYNTAIRLGTFPVPWKASIIVPIPKVAGASQASEYRPVALTSILAKTFERLLYYLSLHHA
jgi:hypothetical protein